jgi:hypothetical protein
MGQYSIYVQGNLVTTTTTTDGYNLGEILSELSADIASGNIAVDSTQPMSISVQSVPQV